VIGSAEEFARLRASQVREEYERAAQESAPPEVWLEVIERYPELRKWVAHNKTTSAEILQTLATDEDPVVRSAVAMRRSCPPDARVSLSMDRDERVRATVARNPKTSEELLRRMENDPSPFIRQLAADRLRSRR
jgi:hypothetical protein